MADLSREEMLHDLATADATGDTRLANHIAGLLGGKPAAAPEKTSLGQDVLEGAASVGTGVLRAGAGVAGLPGTLWNAAGHVAKLVGDTEGVTHAPDAGDISNAMSAFMTKHVPTYGGVYEPKKDWQKDIAGSSEGAASMVGGGPAAKILGAISGLSGELADQWGKGTGGARLLGSAAPLAADVVAKTPELIRNTLGAGVKFMVGPTLSMFMHHNPLAGLKAITDGGASMQAAARALASLLIQNSGSHGPVDASMQPPGIISP